MKMEDKAWTVISPFNRKAGNIFGLKTNWVNGALTIFTTRKQARECAKIFGWKVVRATITYEVK